MSWTYVGLALLCGLVNPVQSGCNGTLNRALGKPLMVIMTSLLVSVAVTLAAALATGRLALPEAERAAAVPWWGWLGGAFGALFLLAQPIAAPKLGAATFTGLTVTAALIGSVLLDQFGLFGFAQHSATWPRVLGCVLMVGGVALISRL